MRIEVDLISITDAAAELGFTPNHTIRLAQLGVITSLKAGKRRFVTRAGLEQFKAARRAKAQERMRAA